MENKSLNENLIKLIINNYDFDKIESFVPIKHKIFQEFLLESRFKHKTNLNNLDVKKIKSFNAIDHVFIMLPMEDYNKSEDIIITGHSSGLLRVWNLSKPNTPQKIYCEHQSFIEELVYLKNLGSSFFASAEGSIQKLIKIWDLNQNVSVKTLNSPYKITALESINLSFTNLYDETANFLLASGHVDTKIILWDIHNENLTKPLIDFKYGGTVSKIFLIQEFENSSHIIYGTYKGVLRMIHLSHKSKKTFKGHLNIIFSIQRIDYNTIVTGSLDSTVRFWNLSTGYCLHTFNTGEGVYNLLNMKEYIKQNYIICTTGKDVQIIKYYYDEQDYEEPIKTCRIKNLMLNYPINRMFYMKRSRRLMFVSFSSQNSTVQLWE